MPAVALADFSTSISWMGIGSIVGMDSLTTKLPSTTWPSEDKPEELPCTAMTSPEHQFRSLDVLPVSVAQDLALRHQLGEIVDRNVPEPNVSNSQKMPMFHKENIM